MPTGKQMRYLHYYYPYYPMCINRVAAVDGAKLIVREWDFSIGR